MGETKKNKDKTSKRRGQLCGLEKSSSDSEIARGKGKERWPFPQSLTVDELARYRRRRVQGRPKDSLCRAEGSLGNKISEYRRAFRASSEDVSNLSRSLPAGAGTQDASASKPVAAADATDVMEAKTESSRFIPHLNAPSRPPQLRRGTSIKIKGKFSSDTEQAKYVPHTGIHRAELARRPTSLKMEGDMNTTSENCEKFIEWLNVSRPELARLPTHLKLEGDFETATENHDQYVPFVGARRPEILRQNASLRLEGDCHYIPEYKDVFKDHEFRGKRLPKKPETHLRTGGNFYNTTETSEQFVNPRSMINADHNLDVNHKRHGSEDEDDDDDDDDDEEEEDLNVLRMKEDRKIERSDTRGPPLEIPEYRDAFKDFPRERPKLIKPGDEIGRSDGSKVVSPSPSRSRFSTKIDMDPEYNSKFPDLGKESPVYRKPPLALRPSVQNGTCANGRRSSSGRIDPREGSTKKLDDGPRRKLFEATSEVRSQYVPYGNVPRVESMKKPSNLMLEGKIDLQPEYRNAYCSKKNYQLPGEPRIHRRRERSSSESRRRDNHWTSNYSGENFGHVNASADQDAFQILRTRVHEDTVVGKPPSGSRRGSLAQPATTHADLPGDPSTLRKRSPSPTYRLHVCNVDDEPRGFGRRKQSDFAVDSRAPVPDNIGNYPQRSYSPSFGRGDPKSFVVLQDSDRPPAGKYAGTEYRGRNPDGDNHGSALPGRESLRPRNRTPPNWMRPWYDNSGH